ncbi:DegV family protein [Lachnospiraceae bacterium ASD3451]|uniref:DegV family protein n=1 Tax=Diplocloster agilis TaxID=2850323 RepID=UPI001DB561F7|nr:DegV family protein [Diplocloster agilis]MBU9746724.1 DegV family protein [Diplocloster agilis]
MHNFEIFCDSSCDTPTDLLNQYKIRRIPFYVSFDQEHYEKEIEELSISDFYKRLTSKKVFPKTSLPSVQDYLVKFKETLKEGREILCVCLTSKFSGSYQSAVTARMILEEDYPEANIAVVDSMQATSCEGLTVLQAAYMREAGYSLDETVKKLEQLRLSSRIMFTVGTLEYLQKGGRIGKVSSIAGTMLNLKPLIQLKDGELIPYGTIRGRNKSLDKTLSMVAEYFSESGANYSDYDFCVTTGTCVEEAEAFQKQLEDMIGRKIDYPLFQIGVTIGTNTGPDAIGACFIKKFNV